MTDYLIWCRLRVMDVFMSLKLKVRFPFGVSDLRLLGFGFSGLGV